MAPQPSQTWFDIARKVNALLGLPGAREHFRERVEEAAAEWQRRSDAKRKREEARSETLKTEAPKFKRKWPRRRKASQPPPKRKRNFPQPGSLLPKPEGSFYFAEKILAPNTGYDPRTDNRSFLEAWLPAELSPDLDPDDSLPLPVLENREVSLAERYAVLAAVWDARWEGDEKINSWPGPYDQMEREEYKREGLPGSAYELLVFLVRPTKGDAPTVRLRKKDRAIVQTWIADVEADLASGSHISRPEATKIARRVDTKVDKKKLSTRKKRGFTPAARQCAKKYKAKRKAGQKTTMKAVIRDYLDENPDAKESSISRSLSDHPEEWKVDTKVDKAL